MSHPDVFEVVFVCTGNQARSPLAEALFRRHSRGLKVHVTSVGTLNVRAVPALPLAVEAGRRLGVDLTGHRARALRPGMLASADLVLGFEPFHVAAAIVDGKAEPSRVFLLGELVPLLGAPLAADDPYAHARLALAAADARRVRSKPDPARALVDPLGKPADVMSQVAAEIDLLVRRLVSGLFGRRPVEASAQTPAWPNR